MAFKVVRSDVVLGAESEVVKSGFLITINSQRAYTDIDDARRAALWMRDTVSTIGEDFASYLKMYRNDPEERVQVAMDDRQIQDGTVEPHIEVGKKFHKLHSHTVVTFSHSSRYSFRVDLAKLRADLPRGFHLDVKYIPDGKSRAEHYARKSGKEGRLDYDSKAKSKSGQNHS